MLKLVSTQKNGSSYPLLVDTKYVIGRKQGDITFPDDQSVSRVHAEVIVEHPAGNINEPMLTPVLTLTDMGSKFGTFATEGNIQSKTGVNAREPVTLSIGEKIRFGLQWNEFRIDYTNLVLTSSSFRATTEFKSKIVKLGGHFINEWNEYVTHVVMESLTLTVKAVCALLAAKPIVTPAYVTNLVSAFETKTDPPEPKSYLPPIVEKGMSNLPETQFYPNTERTTLFAGKTFLFCNQKHLKKLAAAIEAGGGIARLVADVVGANVLSSEFIIMGHPQDTSDEERDSRVKAILDTYKKGGKRLITDSEIGLAAVYNSIEKHCNPKFNMTNVVLPLIPTQTQGSSDSVPIVPETQNLDSSSIIGNGDTSINIVNETVVKQENEEQTTNSARSQIRGEKRSVADSGNNASKKRSATDDLSKPETKRAKEGASATASSSRSGLSSQKPNSARMLNSLFNFSSDEDEDDILVVPETQPNVTDDSQRPLVKVVDVRNLQSLTSTQESSVVGHVSDDEVIRVPASPESEPENDVIIRRSGTDFIQTVTTSLMNAPTVPVPSTVDRRNVPDQTPKKTPKRTQGSGIKINVSVDEEVPGSSKKRRREEDEANVLAAKTKKINLEDPIVKKEPVSEYISGLPLVKKPLLNKNRSLDASLIGATNPDKSIDRKNFKSFRKVPPKFISLDSSVCQENRSHNSTDVSVETNNTNLTKIKLKTIEYYPGNTRYTFMNTSSTRNDNGMSDIMRINDDPPLQPVGSRDVEIREERSRMQVQPEATTSKAAGQPSTVGRRVSPRKKGPAVKLHAPPPPIPAPVIQADLMEESEEDEDDMWSFNR